MEVVTGGLGFIGSHLVEELLRRGSEVTLIDNRDPRRVASEDPSIGAALRRVKIVRGDVRDKGLIENTLREASPSVVYHLAALASHRLSVANPYPYLDVNIWGVANVLEAARRIEPTPHIVFASSSSVYGDNEPPLREEMTPRPKGPYAVSKLVGEELCRTYSETYGMSCVALRYFNVVGERCRENIVLKIFVDEVARGSPPRVNGRWIDGVFHPATRDFTYVKDIVDGTLRAGALKTSFEILNIGCGRPVSVLDLAGMVIEEIGRADIRPRWAELEPHEVLHSYSDNSKIRRLLGWSPTTDIKTIVKRYISWYRSRGSEA